MITMDLRVRFLKDYKVFSNGTRESVTDNGDGTLTWHYRMARRHPFFSTALVIGDYSYKNSLTEDGIPLELWYYPDQEDHFGPTYRYSAEMVDFFNDEFGFTYPYELYKQAPVQDYLYGAMETTTATVFGDYQCVDERAFDGRNYVNTNAHELAHQWFGDCLMHLRGCDVWLTESFATYYAKIFEKYIYGEDQYQKVRNQEFAEVMEAERIDQYPVGHSRGGRASWYPKGSLVLDMLRDVLGEEDFKASIKYYLEENAFSTVSTQDFILAVNKASGMSLDWFFDEWVFRGGYPHYGFGWKRVVSEDGILVILADISQIHEQGELIGVFSMPIDIDVYYEDGTFTRTKIFNDRNFQQVSLPVDTNRTVAFVLFDPGRKILKKVTYPRQFSELSSQLLMAKEMIDRYDALVELRNFSYEEKKAVLLEAYENEKFNLIRSEIISQLAGHDDPEALQLFRSAIADTDVYVRRAVAEHVKVIPAALQKEYESLLGDKSYIVVQKALENLCGSFPEKTSAYLERTKNETGWRGKNIRNSWLRLAILDGKTKYIPELLDYSGPAYEFETRINAINALRELGYFDEAYCGYLFDAFLYWNYKVSNAAKESIQYFARQSRYKNMMIKLIQDGRFSVEEKERLEQVIKT
jgi:aminopeptidase N